MQGGYRHPPPLDTALIYIHIYKINMIYKHTNKAVTIIAKLQTACIPLVLQPDLLNCNMYYNNLAIFKFYIRVCIL